VHRQLHLRGYLPDLLFGVLSNREQYVIEGFTLYVKQSVRLVLIVIEPTTEVSNTVDGFEAGIVAGGDIIGIDKTGIFEQFAEFELTVANDTRIGGTSPAIFVDEIIDDGLDIFLKVERVEADAETRSDISGITGIFRAAAAVMRRVISGGYAKAHEYAGNLVAVTL